MRLSLSLILIPKMFDLLLQLRWLLVQVEKPIVKSNSAGKVGQLINQALIITAPCHRPWSFQLSVSYEMDKQKDLLNDHESQHMTHNLYERNLR